VKPAKKVKSRGHYGKVLKSFGKKYYTARMPKKKYGKVGKVRKKYALPNIPWLFLLQGTGKIHWVDEVSTVGLLFYD